MEELLPGGGMKRMEGKTRDVLNHGWQVDHGALKPADVKFVDKGYMKHLISTPQTSVQGRLVRRCWYDFPSVYTMLVTGRCL